MVPLRTIYVFPSKSLEEVPFGCVRLRLKEFLDSNGITRNQLSVYSGINYRTIDRFYKNTGVERVDLGLLAKICYVLNCKVEDLLVYQPPEEDNR